MANPPERVGTNKRRHGPKPSITADVVQRVADRYGMGIPLQDALAAEENPKINLSNWKQALAAHPELKPPYDAAKGKFLEYAMLRLRDSDKLEHLIFLLRTRRADLFALPAPVAVAIQQTTTITGLPDDILERARIVARTEAKAING